jgi:signal transduction histidine kinase
MGTRTLEARLTARLFALVGAVLVALGIASVVVTAHVLDESDTEAAWAHAVSASNALEREKTEGDSPEEALREVVADAQGEGVRLSILRGGTAAGVPMQALAPGVCALVIDDRGAPWQTCAAEGAEETLVMAGVPVAAHRAVVRELTRGMGTVVLVALLAMWLAVRKSLRGPLAELAAVARWTAHIAEAEPARPAPPTKTREIVQLEAAFGGLVKRLLEALARERASSAQIAHELRTPLTAIVAELQTLHCHNAFETAPDDEVTRAAIGRVLGDAGRLSDVIDAILVLSTSAQKSERDDAIVNVADLARELAPAGTSVEAPDEALVETDERLVRLALRNLIENARKYASGARVLRVSRDGAVARLSVVDDGPGLDPAARGRMFERYWRGAADSEGRGLGLALVRAVAERYGGCAEAQPGALGRGLEVSMTLERLVGWHDEAPEGCDPV